MPLAGRRREQSRARLAAWACFLATTLHLAFLRPNITLITGERAKVFSGLLCALCLAVCLLDARRREAGSRTEVLVSLALAALMAASGLAGLTPFSSSLRGFVVLASGLGGFWCARLLLTTPEARRFFVRFSLATLAGVLLVGLISHLVWGEVHRALDVNQHPAAARILLLWFAPLAVLLGPDAPPLPRLGAWLLLGLSYLVLYLNILRSTLVIPLLLGVQAALFKAWRWRYLLLAALPLSLAILYFFLHLPPERTGKSAEPIYYRVENYRFSLYLALRHPVLGIGLRAPREGFLDAYDIKYPHVTREQFTESVRRIRTSENIFLTFLAEVGIPFTLLYVFALATLLTRLVRRARAPDPRAALPPLALLLPLTAGLLHFQVLDGLLHPQVSWFFHVLLGLIGRDRHKGGRKGVLGSGF
ncbi:MAG: hypothetical protein FJ128_00560 [Deltaproteobacteria bacterium]|nr:hypothetical protein [Deltaproteobacteria bacterium]